MKRFIPYGRQSIDESDIQTVIEVLKSDWLTQGPTIEEFEKSCAQLSQAAYGCAMNSATSALHVACLALDLSRGDILWTTPNTFVASSNCALYCGATVDFVDIDPKTYNISPEALEEKLIKAKKANKLPKILVVVHFAGQSCDMKEIKKLADSHGIKVIEDASHAIGGRYLDKPIGNGEYSDITIFSFHPVKIITTAEGGMLLTNSSEIKHKADLFRSHGITRSPQFMTEESHGAWYYQQIELGFNYRMTDLQAGLGLSQLKRIDHFIERRKVIASIYDEALKNLPLVTPWQSENASSAYHLYPIQLNLETLSITRREVFDALRVADIGVNVHYIPVHTQPYYQKLGFRKGDFPVAEAYYERAISLPIHAGLTDSEQSYVVDTLSKILSSR